MVNQPEQLDSDVVNLAKAIRQTESGGNFNARGKSGEFGAYQYTPPTWDKYAKKHGVNVSLDQATPEQQNEVTYKQIKEWKDGGYNPGQIASLWNSGKPDAYLDKKYKGVNKYGVTYDVPKYAESVATAYQQIKAGQTPPADPQNPSSIANTTPLSTPDKPKEGFFSGLLSSVTDPISQLGGSILGMVTPGKQKDVEGITGNKVDTFGYRDGQELSGIDTAKQIGGNALQNVATVGLGGTGAIGKATGILGKVAAGAKVGATLGALQGGGTALNQGKGLGESLGSATTGGTLGAITGGVLGGVGGALSKLPERLTQGAFKGVDSETAQYALQNKKLGSISKMLTDSDSSMDEIGNQVEKVLKQADNFGKSIDGANVYKTAVQGNPNISGSGLQDSGYSIEQLAKITKNVAKNQSALIDELFNGDLSLVDANRLKTALGKVINWSALDNPGTAANKKAASQVYFALSNLIKNKAKDTIPLFEQFEKEIPLKMALQKMSEKGGILGGNLSYKDLLVAILGSQAAGVPGILGAGALHVANTPIGQFAGGKLLDKTSNLIGNKAYLSAGLIGKSLQSKQTKADNQVK